MGHWKQQWWRLGDNLNDVVNLNAISFAFSMQSDGVKAHLLFEKPILLQIEIRRLPGNLDVTAWTKGVYHLDKGPRGLNEARIENSRIVGLDPGVSSMITATSTQDEMSRPGLWQQEVEVRTRSYHARTQVFLEYQEEANNRTKYNIQDEYDQFAGNSSNFSAAADFEQQIRVMSRVRNRMRFFKHREIRATLASARHRANHHIMNQLLGLTLSYLGNNTPHKKDYAAEQRCITSIFLRKGCGGDGIAADAKQRVNCQIGFETKMTRSFSGVTVRCPLYPTLRQFHMCDSYCSWLNSHWSSTLGSFELVKSIRIVTLRLYPYGERTLGRPIGKAAMKRKRVQTRIRRTRGRKVKTCVNMGGQRLHRQSLCTQGQQQGTELWSLKRCLNHDHDVVIDRDRNAARNMRRIGLNYMIMDGDQDHRPVPLRHPQLIGHQ
ncbi:hypothetical protein BJV82DRAFT_667639 [Fennellomyces sp. T-0311]|nr:hypothetical protein BJV82DRAFT_667639 [Fennellomyces sp. T-0311]